MTCHKSFHEEPFHEIKHTTTPCCSVLDPLQWRWCRTNDFRFFLAPNMRTGLIGTEMARKKARGCQSKQQLQWSPRSRWLKLAYELDADLLVPGGATATLLYDVSSAHRLYFWSWWADCWFGSTLYGGEALRAEYMNDDPTLPHAQRVSKRLQYQWGDACSHVSVCNPAHLSCECGSILDMLSKMRDQISHREHVSILETPNTIRRRKSSLHSMLRDTAEFKRGGTNEECTSPRTTTPLEHTNGAATNAKLARHVLNKAQKPVKPATFVRVSSEAVPKHMELQPAVLVFKRKQATPLAGKHTCVRASQCAECMRNNIHVGACCCKRPKPAIALVSNCADATAACAKSRQHTRPRPDAVMAMLRERADASSKPARDTVTALSEHVSYLSIYLSIHR
jgi:hypothetical protein